MTFTDTVGPDRIDYSIRVFHNSSLVLDELFRVNIGPSAAGYDIDEFILDADSFAVTVAEGLRSAMSGSGTWTKEVDRSIHYQASNLSPETVYP